MNPIRHQLEREALGITDVKAVVEAWPDTPRVYCSPIAGEPDTTVNVPLGSVDQIGTGYLLPKSGGIVTEIGFIAQGNVGAGAVKNLRYNIVSVKKDVTAECGLRVDENLLNGLTTIADNYNGVTAITGLNLVVPKQFMIFWKATADGSINCQKMRSAGPIPGVLGALNGSTLYSTVAYAGGVVDFEDPPRVLVPDEEIRVSFFNGIAAYIKWKGE